MDDNHFNSINSYKKYLTDFSSNSYLREMPVGIKNSRIVLKHYIVAAHYMHKSKFINVVECDDAFVSCDSTWLSQFGFSDRIIEIFEFEKEEFVKFYID